MPWWHWQKKITLTWIFSISKGTKIVDYISEEFVAAHTGEPFYRLGFEDGGVMFAMGFLIP